MTFPVDPTVKAQAIAELKTTVSDLPLVINDPVAGYISYFSSKGRGTLMRSLEPAGRYHAMISGVLAEEKVPQDLIYQAVAESGFQPQAVNGRSGAGGMWQFMPSGEYGLSRNGWYDERFDPQKSTHAYARYMKELYSQLGDWYLAMAAYDWGPATCSSAVQRTGYADFWELYRRNVYPGNQELCPHHHRRRDHGQESEAVRTTVADPGPAAAHRRRNHGLQRGSPPGVRPGRSAGTGDHGPQSKPAADEYARPTVLELHLPAGSKDLFKSASLKSPSTSEINGGTRSGAGETLRPSLTIIT